MLKKFTLIFLVFPLFLCATPKVTVGIDVLLTTKYLNQLRGKRVGLITNHTAMNKEMVSTAELLKMHAKRGGYTLAALFAPEHGLTGAGYAWEHIHDTKTTDNIPIYSLHGKTRRPTPEMLKGIDLLVYDIQDLGSRSYTYATTLFYAMEEAAKAGIPLIVLDRPNPINGITIDGPMLEEKWRSYVGYINVPYCHGMTIGELARFFNEEYSVGCKLTVVPMEGWKRSMTFQDTGLTWIPTSPHIPEPDTAFYYPTTGILGELQIVNIGIGYTLPFKLVGAPWIDADRFARNLNAQQFPGVHFFPFYYRPFYGRFANENCQGVMIAITDHLIYRPVATQYLIIGILKSLHSDQFHAALKEAAKRKEMFCKVNGTEEIYRMLTNEKYVVWKLREFHQEERKQFAKRRQKYLIPSYQG